MSRPDRPHGFLEGEPISNAPLILRRSAQFASLRSAASRYVGLVTRRSAIRWMRLQHCAIAISFSMSFAMSCRQLASFLKSQAAQASISSISREISRLSFSDPPILTRTPCRVSPLG